MSAGSPGISTKVTLIAATAATVAILCVVAAFVVQDLRLLKTIKQEQIQTETSLIATSLAVAMNNQQPLLAQQMLQAAHSEHGILASAVLLPDASLYAEQGIAEVEIGATISDAYLNMLARQYPSRVQVHSVPVVAKGETLARLVSLVSYEDIHRRVMFMSGYGLMAFVLALLIAVFISWLVQRIVTNPIKNLSLLSRRISATGDYSLRAEYLGSDELGHLAQGINLMLEQIQIRDKNLERQVRKRTRELEELAEAFRYRALHDSLTGLPNRALLREEYTRAMAHANRAGKYFALLMLDIDNFKTVNDHFGHEFGDQLLKEVAGLIVASVRGEDRVCRLGGDEFVLLVEGIEQEADVVTVANSLLKDLCNELRVMDRKVHVSVSIGASLYPRHGSDLVELKRKADIAMYEAKNAGKNQLVMFRPEMENRALHRLLVQQDLFNAVSNNELEIHYQPQVDVTRKALVGVESLLRWRNRHYGLLQPDEFVVFAEENGLIKPIDYYVLQQACRQSRHWQQALGMCVPVSVNLSAIHFRNMDIVGKIRHVLEETGLPAGNLSIELGESALSEDSNTSREVALALRELGVHLVLDNFGVGVSSLHNLRRFPVDTIKLDRSFSRYLHNSESERKLARGIVSLTREYDVKLIAEGVESARQAETLLEMGCELMQGFWYAQPCDRLAFETWFASQNYADASLNHH